MKFHWVKVRDRIIYKILLIVHNCLHQNAPNEIISMLWYVDSARTMNLRETKTISTFGDRAFSHVGQKLWNLLPTRVRNEHNITTFKKTLKSFLMERGDEFNVWTNRR